MGVGDAGSRARFLRHNVLQIGWTAEDGYMKPCGAHQRTVDVRFVVARQQAGCMGVGVGVDDAVRYEEALEKRTGFPGVYTAISAGLCLRAGCGQRALEWIGGARAGMGATFQHG